jgi:hypothetical protein
MAIDAVFSAFRGLQVAAHHYEEARSRLIEMVGEQRAEDVPPAPEAVRRGATGTYSITVGAADG